MKHPKGYMKAQDLFLADARQVFDLKTGNYICLELPGQEIPDLFTPEVKPEKVKEDPNQIKLF